MIEYYKNLSLENLPYINNEGLICWEEFKDIPDYEEFYQVSDLGRVKSLARTVLKKGKYPFICKEKILSQVSYKDDYTYLTLHKNSIRKIKRVHQLVALVFLHHIPCKWTLVINHKNFKRWDNRLENLEIVTQRENSNLKHIKSSSIFVGVCWRKQSNKWQSQILVNGKKKKLGLFDDELEASEYYKNALLAIQNGEEIQTKLHKFSSEYRGVVWDKSRNKWKSELYINGIKKYLGRFDTEQEAIDTCKKAKE